MRKAIQLSCTFLLCASTIVGCSTSNKAPENTTAYDATTLSSRYLAGTWEGVGYAIGQAEDYNADYLNLVVEENGDYELTDNVSDESILKGTLSVKSEDTLSIENDEEPDVTVLGWEDLKKSDELTCTILNSNSIALIYDNISYVFEKKDSDANDFSLLDQTVNSIWYSADGSESDKLTYELSFNDSSFQLFAIKGKSTPQLLTSFIYQNHKDKNYTFFTYLDKKKPYPDIFSSIDKGVYTSIDLDFSIKDNTLTLTRDGKELTFYSNLIYGLETGSDAYVLCNTSFQWAFDSTNHFCYITLNPDTDKLYFYMTDAESPAFTTATVCGELDVNQDKKTITYHFDEGASSEAGASSSIYEKCESMDGKTFPYTIDDKTLHITIDKQDYNFSLEEY